MSHRILITGGAGFIGSHLADELLAHGHAVRALDTLDAQVHGPGARRPEYLSTEVELLVGDVRDPAAVERALDGVDAVFHFAARVGVGQSMYEIASYTGVNSLGTAVLLEALARRPVAKLLVASSMSIYGEGLYRVADGRRVVSAERTLAQLEAGEWEPRGPAGEPLDPVPTSEDKAPTLSSVYALGKYDQERLCLMVGRAYAIPTLALRFFNVYGPRQALSNPYTGVLAIFAARLLNGRAPLIFEDGRQQRDFVHVSDVARACRLALEREDAVGLAINVGSGRASTVAEIADRCARAVGRPEIVPEITGTYRVGDIRHCFADIGRARRLLGFEPRVDLESGLTELAGWLAGRTAVDRVAEARDELERRGLALDARERTAGSEA
ncbi:MAG: NAD-dependent epimerase/dehydratase family protein [Acidobacteria bacterium]|nr:NAD-dependent epimerase/dehydratase family protein [Acidobacteriota bacterium]